MRIFHVAPLRVQESDALPDQAPADGFLWIACTRGELEAQLARVQQALVSLAGCELVDLHVTDLVNDQLPSHYDYTAQYDILVFRRLAPEHPAPADAARRPAEGPAPPAQPPQPDMPLADMPVGAPPPGEPAAASQREKRTGPRILRRIDTSPVGFAVFDRVLLTVHPEDCLVRDTFASRLLATTAEARASGSRLPTSPADLMMRIVNQMVDGYLELRRELTHQLDHWQHQLLLPKSRFNNWGALLDARMSLHQLEEICEDQRAAVQDWIDALETWPESALPGGERELDLLKVRSRDVLEHIERVIHHVGRLEHSAETAVQMHFSAQSHRTNDIMRTLTALTAIFLPLNLITGFFGMNFEFLPLIHSAKGLWWAIALMVILAIGLGGFFWRKRYLARSSR